MKGPVLALVSISSGMDANKGRLASHCSNFFSLAFSTDKLVRLRAIQVDVYHIQSAPHILGPNHTQAKQCSRLKSSTPFKHDLALPNIPLSKQPFKMQPQI